MGKCHTDGDCPPQYDNRSQGEVLCAFPADIEGIAAFTCHKIHPTASRKKRLVILKWLVGKFEPGIRYPESAVKEIIGRHHPDFATLRRELIGNKLMDRENAVYWRIDEFE